ncbi:MAG: ComEA family DNA-binding protein [Planctomycetota bacterium]|jgi:competence ComEA-like helix-hairpin-helix protein
MTPHAHRTDAHWSDANLVALFVLGGLAGLWLGAKAIGPRAWYDRHPPVRTRRLEGLARRIDPNSASAASLQRLRGVGPAKAHAIVAYRLTHGEGCFPNLNSLTAVGGIGPTIVRHNADELTFPPPEALQSRPSTP